MNCEESKNLMTIGVYAKLTPSEKAQLEEHLRECLRCARIYEKVEKMNQLFNEKQDVPLPNKEKSWQIISAKAVKRKAGWLQRFVSRTPVFQFSAALLILVVGLAAGYFIRPGWQRSAEIAQLRQEVLQIREIAAASLLRQESMIQRLKETGRSSLLAQPASIEDPYLFLSDPAVQQELIQSLSEQTSPLVDIALAFARHIEHFKTY
jgi:hypothetical protein